MGLYANTALHFAVFKKENFEVIKLLLENGADLYMTNIYGESPLHLAALTENKDIVELLLKNNPEVNLKEFQGNTPFGIAFIRGNRPNPEIIKLLLENGADPTLLVNNKYAWFGSIIRDLTPVEIALDHGWDDIVQLLLDHESNK